MYSSESIVDDYIRALCAIEPTAFRSCSAAFWHDSQRIRVCGRPVWKKFPWNPFDIRDRRAQRRNWFDERKDCTGDMSLSRVRQLGSVSKTSNQKRCLFSHACPCSQQSLSSQKLFQGGRWALPTLHLRAVNKLCWGVLMMSVWETK